MRDSNSPARGGDEISATVTGAAALNTAAATTIDNGSRQSVEQRDFGDVNQRGSLFPRAAPSEFRPGSSLTDKHSNRGVTADPGQIRAASVLNEDDARRFASRGTRRSR
jgi:hypothetical protein